MNYNKLRKDCVKDKNNFILYAFTGATVNFKATNNTARDDDAESDSDLTTDLDTDDITTSTTAATTTTTSSTGATGGVTWDNVLDGIASIVSNPTTTATTIGTTSNTTGTPRGRRNNNWGNLRLTNTNWQGKVTGTDTDFETFDTAENGVRAAAKQIQTYITRDGVDTITSIINKWAPTNENNTQGYIQRVAQITGYNPNEKISATDSEKIKNILKAIFTVELGQDLTSNDLAVIDRGIASV